MRPLLLIVSCFVKAIAIANPHWNSSIGVRFSPTDDLHMTPRLLQLVVSAGITIKPTEPSCQYDGTIVFGMPVTLDQSAEYFHHGHIQIAAQTVIVDHINKQRCGVRLDRGQFAIELRYFDDKSGAKTVQDIAESLVSPLSGVDIILGGFSSGLTEHLASITENAQRLTVASLAALESVYEGRDMVFGTLPPSQIYWKSSIEAVAGAGAKTIVTVSEDRGVLKAFCQGIGKWSETFGLNMIETHFVGLDPNITHFEPIAKLVAPVNPDVVVTCTYECSSWVKALRKINWSPRAQMFTTCIGAQDFTDEVGKDAEYMMGASPWHPSLQAIDAVTDWTGNDFESRFKKESSHSEINYHAASYASGVSIVVQALENTSSTDDVILADYIAKTTFESTMGTVRFNENGQNMVPPSLIQHDASGQVQTVFPDSVRSASLLYPMPTWDERDCRNLSPCPKYGSCGNDGACICNAEEHVSIGMGASATCNVRENMNYIPLALRLCGCVLFALLAFMCLLAAWWTWKNQLTWVVKASQPGQLLVIIVGCLISALSVPFMGVEAGYRESSDELHTIADDDYVLSRTDKSCMALPWLYGVGFVVTFSSLLSKIEKVRLIGLSGQDGDYQEKIGFCHVAHIIALMFAIEISILTTWQLVSPMQWEREVLRFENGFPVESVGYCTSEGKGATPFVIGMLSFHIGSLIFALLLCSKTYHIDDDFAESSSVAMAIASMFQVLILAIPIAVLVDGSNKIMYFVEVCAVFMQSFSVLASIFVPKLLKVVNGTSSKPKVSIPMASLTHSKWDEGLDVINQLLESSCDLSDDQKSGLGQVKDLLLKRNRSMDKKAKKWSYIPSNLHNTSTSNTFLIQEFGGVEVKDDQSVVSSSSRDDFRTNNLDIDYLPPEFEALPEAHQRKLYSMLSLSSLDRWGYDIFELDKVTKGNPLLFMGWAILGSPHAQNSMATACNARMDQNPGFAGFFFTSRESGFQVPMRVLCDYLRVIQMDYQTNPYHNAVHAADVLQTLHALIQMADGIEPTQEDVFAILLSAVVHDVKHPGRNNAFQLHARTGVALACNDESILENFHVSHAFARMLGVDLADIAGSCRPLHPKKKSDIHILRNVSTKQFNNIRQKMIQAILHTDMAKHFEFVASTKGIANSRINRTQEEIFESQEEENQTWEMLLFFLHMADISGQAKPDPLFRHWTARVIDEFFAQGDEERRLGLPISALCDRSVTNIEQSQIGFIRYVVLPAFEVLGELVPAVKEKVLPIARGNLSYWELKANNGDEEVH